MRKILSTIATGLFALAAPAAMAGEQKSAMQLVIDQLCDPGCAIVVHFETYNDGPLFGQIRLTKGAVMTRYVTGIVSAEIPITRITVNGVPSGPHYSFENLHRFVRDYNDAITAAFKRGVDAGKSQNAEAANGS